MLIGSFYKPHRCNKTIQELNKSLTTISRNSKPKRLILCGDFNCPDISWEIGNVNTCSPDRSTQQSLIEVTENAQLTQIQNSSTRESKLLNLVFTTNPTKVTYSVFVRGISDHDIIVTDFDVNIQYINKQCRQIYQFARADCESLNDDVNTLSNKIKTQYNTCARTESLCSTFKNTLTESFNKHIPSKLSSCRCNLPWLNGKLHRLLKRKRRLYKKAKETNNWTNYKFIHVGEVCIKSNGNTSIIP